MRRVALETETPIAAAASVRLSSGPLPPRRKRCQRRGPITSPPLPSGVNGYPSFPCQALFRVGRWGEKGTEFTFDFHVRPKLLSLIRIQKTNSFGSFEYFE